MGLQKSRSVSVPQLELDRHAMSVIRLPSHDPQHTLPSVQSDGFVQAMRSAGTQSVSFTHFATRPLRSSVEQQTLPTEQSLSPSQCRAYSQTAGPLTLQAHRSVNATPSAAVIDTESIS